MRRDQASKYIDKYGYHFTKDLATDVCNTIFQEPIMEIDSSIVDNLQNGVTEGDLLYYTNVLKSILVPSVFPITSLKFKELPNYANEILNSHYPEKAFTDFLVKLDWEGIDIEWDEY